ncbi:MAG: hypothetical protein E4G91_00420 [Candidatus Zixiibacteriota bacterium]|nr:MAG: hypothetical protein E4G91_00420 [candidate division Zixibacteria bacterium]
MADSQTVTITVSVYVKSVGELLPMAVGNYWVYETSDQYPPTTWTLDSIAVESTYQDSGLTHWLLSGSGLWYLGHDLSIRNDSIIDYWHTVASPANWPERTDTVPAGIFTSTFVDCISNNSVIMDCIIFAKGIGAIRYKYSYVTPRQPETHFFQARLVRYYVK